MALRITKEDVAVARKHFKLEDDKKTLGEVIGKYCSACEENGAGECEDCVVNAKLLQILKSK